MVDDGRKAILKVFTEKQKHVLILLAGRNVMNNIADLRKFL